MNNVTLLMMVGLPGSGKSTYANKMKSHGYVVHSSDSIRKELYGDESIQGDGNKVFRLLHSRIINDLKEGKNVVYDATNIHSKGRVNFLNTVKNIDCKKYCVVFATPIDKCLERNSKRERMVPLYVISKMYRQWETPHLYEGWDDIALEIYDEHRPEDGDVFPYVSKMIGYDQHNSHHKLTLYDHCIAARHYIESIYGYDKNYLIQAAMYHDIGKLKTQTFLDYKGNRTEDAHYYNHNNVGGYDALILFYGYGAKMALDISFLINFHMLPYNWQESKARLKYGDQVVDDLLVLHAADISAH